MANAPVRRFLQQKMQNTMLRIKRLVKPFRSEILVLDIAVYDIDLHPMKQNLAKLCFLAFSCHPFCFIGSVVLFGNLDLEIAELRQKDGGQIPDTVPERVNLSLIAVRDGKGKLIPGGEV